MLSPIMMVPMIDQFLVTISPSILFYIFFSLVIYVDFMSILYDLCNLVFQEWFFHLFYKLLYIFYLRRLGCSFPIFGFWITSSFLSCYLLFDSELISSVLFYWKWSGTSPRIELKPRIAKFCIKIFCSFNLVFKP